MSAGDVRAKLVEDLQSHDEGRVITAARELLALGENGDPPGTHCLLGGKAALRSRRLADAVVLLYHGLRVSEPHTLTWGDLLVNRAVACAHHGFYPDAIDAGTTFLDSVNALPPGAGAFIPYAYHALGLAHDRLLEYQKAAHYHRLAVEVHSDPLQRANAACDLAYSLALSGEPTEGARVLGSVDISRLSGLSLFGYHGTWAIVNHCLGDHPGALAVGQKANALSAGHEDEWASPLAEVHYWMSRSAWMMGDRYRATALALHAAVTADRYWNLSLRDAASDWLAEIMDKGGIRGA